MFTINLLEIIKEMYVLVKIVYYKNIINVKIYIKGVTPKKWM